MYVLGGVGKEAGLAGAPCPASPVPLGSEMFPFAQKACLDFLGNKEQVPIAPMPLCANAPIAPLPPLPQGPKAPRP